MGYTGRVCRLSYAATTSDQGAKIDGSQGLTAPDMARQSNSTKLHIGDSRNEDNVHFTASIAQHCTYECASTLPFYCVDLGRSGDEAYIIS